MNIQDIVKNIPPKVFIIVTIVFSLITLIFLFMVIHSMYFSKKTYYLFGKKFGPTIEQIEIYKKNQKIKNLNSRLEKLEKENSNLIKKKQAFETKLINKYQSEINTLKTEITKYLNENETAEIVKKELELLSNTQLPIREPVPPPLYGAPNEIESFDNETLITITNFYDLSINLPSFYISVEFNDKYKTFQTTGKNFGPDRLYRDIYSIPLKISNGCIVYAEILKILKYRSDGNNATIILTDRKKISGTPLSGCKISGESSKGKFSISLQKIKNIEFNQKNLKRVQVEDNGRLPQIPDDYPASYFEPSKLNLEVTLLGSGEVMNIKKSYLIYGTSSWPKSVWWYKTDRIPLIILTEKGINAVQNNKENIGENKYPVSFLSLSDYGYIHIPFDLIKSVRVNGK